MKFRSNFVLVEIFTKIFKFVFSSCRIAILSQGYKNNYRRGFLVKFLITTKVCGINITLMTIPRIKSFSSCFENISKLERFSFFFAVAKMGHFEEFEINGTFWRSWSNWRDRRQLTSKCPRLVGDPQMSRLRQVHSLVIFKCPKFDNHLHRFETV